MKPFRWTISKREQLGSLLADITPVNLNEASFLDEVRTASARLIALADNADFAFIGRTPENFYDYLSGAFHEIEDMPALHLVHFSLRWAGDGGVRSIDSTKLNAFMDYLIEEGVDAASMSKGPRPLALIDFVAHGGTIQNFVELLHLQAQRDGVDWNSVQRKLRIIGLRVRTHNSPNTWRWQQHQEWLGLMPDAVIKNVSAPAHLLYHLANDQPKVTHSFHPGRWDATGDEAAPIRSEQQQAIALAVQLYDVGTTRAERGLLAASIAKQRQMRQPATRRLVTRLKGL